MRDFGSFPDLLRRPLGHHFPAVNPSPRAEVQHVVRGLDGLPVVLHDHHGVPDVPQPMQRFQELPVVAWVQADGRLVEDVDDPVSSEPIWLASRMRWDSPPERLGARRSSER